jgi:hypothetical protein
MRRSRTKALLSVLATVVSAVLILVYWLAPPGEGSHRLYVFLIDCIPDAVVVLVAIPIVYWLFYRRGLSNMGDCPLFASEETKAGERPPHPCEMFVPWLPAALGRSPCDERASGRREVLVVVEAPCEGGSESLESEEIARVRQNLDSVIRAAEARNMLVVFAGRAQSGLSLAGNGEPPPLAAYRPPGSVAIGLNGRQGASGCSALENPVVDLLIADPRVRTVYVAGMALEHSVRATCRGIVGRCKQVVALEGAIAAASRNGQTEEVWRELIDEGVVRHPGALDTIAEPVTHV